MCHDSDAEIARLNELLEAPYLAASEWAEAEGRPPPGREELFDPWTNLRIGAWYLSRALQYWSDRDDPLPFALAEYNAGRSNAARWAGEGAGAVEFWRGITYPTTRRYIRDILVRYRGVPFPPEEEE